MKTAGKYRIDHIIDSLYNGQSKQAKQQIQYLCKTKPEKQAFRLAQVLGALMDTDNYNDPEMAVTLINLFDKEEA